MNNNYPEYNVNHYELTDSGRYKRAFESAIHAFIGDKDISVRPAGKVDLIVNHQNIECKGGAGVLGLKGQRLLKGVSLMIYAPVIGPENVDKDGNIDLSTIEGFVCERQAWLDAMENAGALRHKSRGGSDNITIQTFWKQAECVPHGRLYFRIIDAMYDIMLEPLDEWLERNKDIKKRTKK